MNKLSYLFFISVVFSTSCCQKLTYIPRDFYPRVYDAEELRNKFIGYRQVFECAPLDRSELNYENIKLYQISVCPRHNFYGVIFHDDTMRYLLPFPSTYVIRKKGVYGLYYRGNEIRILDLQNFRDTLKVPSYTDDGYWSIPVKIHKKGFLNKYDMYQFKMVHRGPKENQLQVDVFYVKEVGFVKFIHQFWYTNRQGYSWLVQNNYELKGFIYKGRYYDHIPRSYLKVYKENIKTN